MQVGYYHVVLACGTLVRHSMGRSMRLYAIEMSMDSRYGCSGTLYDLDPESRACEDIRSSNFLVAPVVICRYLLATLWP